VIAHQATGVAIAGRGLLIEGAPGVGKSSLALALIDRGAVLVGDDSLLLEARQGELIARPHPQTIGLLEVRNLGLLPFPHCDEVRIALVVQLDENAPRFTEQAGQAMRASVGVPFIRLWPHSPVLALRAELALTRFGLC
jgi:serine kinase of HPr protein (carbohydrate metabolism regulator)